MRKILITNDDGISAPGLIRLAQAALGFGQVWVVAPESQRSAMSHSITLRDTVSARQTDFPVPGVTAFACTGTPADCVRIGTLNIVPGGADAVLSGINRGYNLATDLQYSATVGAAFEAAFQRVHAIAFSEAADSTETAERYLKDILRELLDAPLASGEIWNVNFPGCPPEEFRGILRDRFVSSGRIFRDSYSEERSPDGQITFTVNGVQVWEAEEGSDLHAVMSGHISIGKAKNIS